MTNKHEKHFSTVANYGNSDDGQYERRPRRDSVSSDAGLWSNYSVDGGSERDELDALDTDFYDPLTGSHTASCIFESSKLETGLLFQPVESVHLPPKLPSKTPLCDNILQWFDEQTQELGFEAMTSPDSVVIKILPTEEDWSYMLKLSTQAKIAYLLRRFCPESSRASWFMSKERLFFAKLFPQEMIRYLYLSPIDRETLLRTYFKTLGFPESLLISEERKKLLARFVFEGDTTNLDPLSS